jgi:hypothetical protein
MWVSGNGSDRGCSGNRENREREAVFMMLPHRSWIGDMPEPRDVSWSLEGRSNSESFGIRF